MKLIYGFTSPVINGSEWVFDRFSGLLSVCVGRTRGSARRLDRLYGGLHEASGNRLRRAGSDLKAPWTSQQGDNLYRTPAARAGLKQRPDPVCISEKGCAGAAGSSVRSSDLLQELVQNPPPDLSPVRRRQRDKAIALLRDEALLEPTYRFNIVNLEQGPEIGSLQLGDELLPLPENLPKKGRMTAMGFGACTLGPRLEARVRGLFGEKRAALALALDALGNELLQALARRMRSDLLADVRRRGLILGRRLRIGEAEFDLPAQAVVLRLAGAREIGIRLSRGNLTRPQKSSIVTFAVGHKLPKLSLSRYRD